MISRRTILAWFGLAPAVLAIPSIANAPKRARRWAMRLEPDGSSTLAKGDERYLDSWVKTQKPEDWGGSEPVLDADGNVAWTYKTASLDEVQSYIKADAEAVAERSHPWRELEAIEEEFGLDVPVDAKIYNQGTWFEVDLVGPPNVVAENRRRFRERGIHVPDVLERHPFNL